MSEKLLLDEHYSDATAAELRAAGHDVVAVVADPQLLLVPPNRFPRGGGRRAAAIVKALSDRLATAAVEDRPDEDWLV